MADQNDLSRAPSADVLCQTGVIPGPVEEVWAVVRCFGNVSRWLAPVGDSKILSELLVRCFNSYCKTAMSVFLRLGYAGQLMVQAVTETVDVSA